MSNLLPYANVSVRPVPGDATDGTGGFVASASNGVKTGSSISLSGGWTWYGLINWRQPLVVPYGVCYLLNADGATDDIGIVIQSAAHAGADRIMAFSGGSLNSPDSSIIALSGAVPESTWVRIRVVSNGASSLVQVEDTTESGTLDPVSFSGVVRGLSASGVFCAHWQLIEGTVSSPDHDALWGHLATIKDLLPVYTDISRISDFDVKYRAFGNVVLDTGTDPDTLVAVYRHGTDHAATQDGVGKIQTSTDGGDTWGAEATFITAAVEDEVRDPRIVVLSTGRWLVSWFEWDGADARVVRTMYSDNQGSAWSAPVTVTNPVDADYLASAGAACELTSGDLILPTYGEIPANNRRGVILFRSTDDGASWSEDSRITPAADMDEPNLVLYAANKLVCYMRNADLYRSVADETDTPLLWSAATEVDCSGHSSPTVTLLADGTSVLIVRCSPTRVPYSNLSLQATELWTSADDGETWSGPQYPYPCESSFMYGNAVQLADGKVYAWWSIQDSGAGYYWKEITDDV